MPGFDLFLSSELEMIFLGGNKIFGIGLMSGTSADGIDAALVKITQIPFKVELKAFFAFPYSRKIRTRILNALSPKTQLKEIGELNMEIGEQFAQAVLKLLKKERISPDSIAFIGSHGQTLYHQPPSSVAENQPPFTFQIGEGSVIAQKTTILTVSDFRAADIACGGEGAPLVPYVDWLLFTHPKKGRALLNLGGIANFTYLPPGGKLSEITAGDTGPGNGLLDSLVQKKFKGRISCDVDGRLASKGKVDQKILKELLSHPFIQKKIPKSAEKSWFGKELVHKLLRKKLAIEDLLATAAAFTAESVVLHLLRYASQIDEIYVSGGGVKNLTLMKMLQKKVKETFSHKISVYSLEKLGIPSKAKEALCFAILAYETLSGKPSNVPQVTGAEKCCILGKISLVKELQCRSQISL